MNEFKEFISDKFKNWSDEKKSTYLYIGLYVDKDSDSEWDDIENLYDHLIKEDNIVGLNYYRG